VPRLGASCGEGRRSERADERTAGEDGRSGLSCGPSGRPLNGLVNRLGRGPLNGLPNRLGGGRCDGRR
jgi:hypothetical protein